MTKQFPSSNETALRLLSAMLGIFFLALGLDKASWFGDSSELNRFFQNWLKSATVLNEWYLRQLAVPWISVWTRLVPLGELSVGVALLLGIVPRAAAMVGMFMVMNIHFASGALFRNSVLTSGNVLPVLGGLLALAIAARHVPWSVYPGLPSTPDNPLNTQRPDVGVSTPS